MNATLQPVDPMTITKPPRDEENTPLLPHMNDDDDNNNSSNDDDDDNSQTVKRQPLKQRIAQSLASRPGHYCVLALVFLDIASIFAALVVGRFACEGRSGLKPSTRAEHALDIVALIFSCLFVVELGARVLVSGWAYFQSWFDCLDAVVIVLGFAVGVVLEDVLGEIASLVVMLRLLRVFRITEEVDASAEEGMEGLRGQIAFLFRENESLRGEVMCLRAK